MTSAFFIDFLIKTTIYFGIMWLTGILVLSKGVKVNYTRKINHFALLVVPYLINILTRRPPSGGSSSFDPFMQVVALLSGLLFFILFVKPLRERVRAFDVAFHGIDRPEDRPHTLLWMTTQTAGNFLASIPLSIYLGSIGKPELIFILILINGIGDGLAEPVGVRFGRHKYRTTALFTKKTYTRSLEGSLCVFLASIAALLLFFNSFTSAQLALLLLTLPAAMTLTEAKAPHTWDNPLLFLSGSAIIFLVVQFVG